MRFFFCSVATMIALGAANLLERGNGESQRYQREVLSWPVVKAEVTAIRYGSWGQIYGRRGGTYAPKGPVMHYRYTVDGNAYLNYDLAYYLLNDREASLRVIKELGLRKGSIIEVHYNPRDPRQSCYNPEYHGVRTSSSVHLALKAVGYAFGGVAALNLLLLLIA